MRSLVSAWIEWVAGEWVCTEGYQFGDFQESTQVRSAKMNMNLFPTHCRIPLQSFDIIEHI